MPLFEPGRAIPFLMAAMAAWGMACAGSTWSAESAASRSLAITGEQPAPLLEWMQAPPLGLPRLPQPETGPPNAEWVALGRKLFFDRRLSFNKTLSCAMCHVPEQGFTQNELQTPVGIEGRSVKRNAPSLYNVAYRQHLFHDGREYSLENQVWQPLLKSNEMANPSVGYVVNTVRDADDYHGLFEAAFDRPADMQTISIALASYQRGLLSANSSFDQWYFGGQKDAMSASALHGFELFRHKGCIQCHAMASASALFTDQQFHDTGIGFARTMLRERKPEPVRLAPGVEITPTVSFSTPQANDLGRYEATGRAQDRWRYLTPSLRNIALTAPYMHDGSLGSLAEVLQFYNNGGVLHPGLDPRIRPLDLSATDLDDLENFLRSLTGSNIEELRRDGRSTAIGDTLGVN